MRRSRRTCTSATAPAARTTRRARARGRRRARTRRWSATWRARGVPARAAQLQRQSRRHRLLLGRTPRLSRRLQLPGIDALVDCWGGNVVVNDPAKQLDAKQPVAPIDLTEKLDVPDDRHLRQRRPESRTASTSTAPRRCSRSSARTTSSTATTAAATASSTATRVSLSARAGGSTAGTRSSPS